MQLDLLHPWSDDTYPICADTDIGNAIYSFYSDKLSFNTDDEKPSFDYYKVLFFQIL